jgi:hypothetical protein
MDHRSWPCELVVTTSFQLLLTRSLPPVARCSFSKHKGIAPTIGTRPDTHLPLCNNQGIAPVPLTSSSAEALPDAVGIPMATLNSQGKRPSPDDEGSEMSDISESNSVNGRERRTVKRQRTSSSQSEVEDQPAQFVPGLWSIVASVKNLFGLGSSGKSGPLAICWVSKHSLVERRITVS